MLPAERPFAWLGGLRPSDAAVSVLAKLAGTLPQAQRGTLEALKVWALPVADMPCPTLFAQSGWCERYK